MSITTRGQLRFVLERAAKLTTKYLTCINFLPVDQVIPSFCHNKFSLTLNILKSERTPSFDSVTETVTLTFHCPLHHLDKFLSQFDA